MNGMDGRGDTRPSGGAVPAPRPSISYVRDMMPSVTITAEHRETGEVVVVVGEADAGRGTRINRWMLKGKVVRRFRTEGRMYGKISDAVLVAIDKIERRPGPWRVLSISYPSSILIDLRGGWRIPPEPLILKRVGRLDLWCPNG